MNSRDKRAEIIDPTPRAPYERPELKKIGKLRDITANTSPGMDVE
jgi:hypothetical protein